MLGIPNTGKLLSANSITINPTMPTTTPANSIVIVMPAHLVTPSGTEVVPGIICTTFDTNIFDNY